MARDHARIFTSIWSDPDWKLVSPDGQRLYLLLLSQGTINHAGVLPLMLSKWAKGSVHSSTADVEESLAELVERNFVVVDDDTEEVLVRSFIRRDGVWKHPNSRKAAINAAKSTESNVIRAALADEIRRIGGPDAEAVIADLAVSHPDPIPIPSGTDIEPDETVRGKGRGKDSSPSSPSVVVKKRSPRSQAKRGTRIPDDFRVTPEMTKWARERVPELAGRNETEKFVNYWRAKSGREAVKLDWEATWRNWMLTASERTPTRASPNGVHPTDQNVALLMGTTLRALPGGQS